MTLNINNPFTAAEAVVDILTWKQLCFLSQGHRDRAVKEALSQGLGTAKIMYDALQEICLSCLALLQGHFYLYVFKPANKTPFDSTLSTAKNTCPGPLTRKLSELVFKWEQGVTGGLCRCCPVSRDEQCLTSLVWSHFPCSSRLPAPQVKPNLPFLPPHCMCTWKPFNRFSVCLTGAHVHAWAEMCIVTWTPLAGWQVIKIKHIHVSYD